MRLGAEAAAAAMDGKLEGTPGVARGVSIDTRTLAPGDLFFAIRGLNRDGHAFVPAALAQGAAGAVVEARGSSGTPEAGRKFLIRVDDTTRALGALARHRRLESGARVVAITGSVGKTTTRAAAAAAIGAAFPVFQSRSNWNNHWGLPLSLLAAEGEPVGVVELGMSAPGEIRDLTAIAVPDCGLITTIAEAHLEFFGSLDAIADAKGELYEALPAGAVAVVNADDARVQGQADRFAGRRLTYGFSSGTDVHGAAFRALPDGLEFRASACGGAGVPVRCRLEGHHNAMNVLAGIAAATALGVPLEAAAGGVAELAPLPGRGRRIRLSAGATAIDDTYNANPRAMLAAIRSLAAAAPGPGGRRVLVAGAMLELGAASEALHARCGRTAAAAGLDLVVGVGALGAVLAEAAARRGAPAATAGDPDAAAELLAGALRPGDLALFKASRGVRLERALRRLEGEAR